MCFTITSPSSTAKMHNVGSRKAQAMSHDLPWMPPSTDESMWLPSALFV